MFPENRHWDFTWIISWEKREKLKNILSAQSSPFTAFNHYHSGQILQMTNWWFFFSYFSQKTESDISCKLSSLLENKIWDFMQLVSIGDNLSEMSNPGKNKKNIINFVCWISPESFGVTIGWTFTAGRTVSFSVIGFSLTWTFNYLAMAYLCHTKVCFTWKNSLTCSALWANSAEEK